MKFGLRARLPKIPRERLAQISKVRVKSPDRNKNLDQQVDQELLAARFRRDGFVVIKRVLTEAQCDSLVARLAQELDPLVGPVEFEADVGYPGAPTDRSEPGGETPRRLLHAYARGQEFRDLAESAKVTNLVRFLLGEGIRLTQCHHNCVMTKYPGFSSATAWHQDVRYWSFDTPDLITAWIALDREERTKGALRVLPKSHQLELDRGRLDKNLFLRTECPENKQLIRQAQEIELDGGDVLLFHARLFHAAGKNLTETPKFSVVFSYHGESNLPIPGTRSATLPSLSIESETTPPDIVNER
ncbi:MAG: phytanoyl-CoA dioxygenase family protein [Pseudomonadales bacterium]|nr:phytanoyl-CoA dioxygenase family protein [Pseudomonadales bacterium]